MQAESRIRAILTIGSVTVCLGTLTAATAVVAASLLVVFLPPVLILPYIGWALWAMSMWSKGGLRVLSAPYAIALMLAAIPVCAYLPFAIASQEMLLRAANMPSHPDLAVTEVSPDPFGNSSTGPGLIYRLAPLNGALPAIRGFSDQIVSEGWTIVAGGVPSARGADFGVLFRGPDNRTFSLYARWNRTLHVYEDITIRQNLSPMSPGILLFCLIAAGVISAGYVGRKGRKPDDGTDV